MRKLFERLRRYQLKLNPTKCIFGVKSGKLLGFMVCNEGIKVDPDKVKVIQEMLVYQTKKEIRGGFREVELYSSFHLLANYYM